MNQMYLNYIDALNERYENAHKSAYIRAKPKYQRYMLRFNNRLFSRFYHTTLLPGTLLSPANLVRLMNENETDGYLYPMAHISPQKAAPYGMSFSLVSYSADAHPAASDLRTLIECVYPAFNLDLQNKLPLSDEKAILHELSVNDPDYLYFLIDMAIRTGVLKPVPAVNVSRFCVSGGANNILDAPDADILKLLVKHSSANCAQYISKLIPGFNLIVEPGFIEGLLLRPLSINDITGRVYSMMVSSFQHMMAKGFEFEVTSPYFDSPKHSTKMNDQDLFALFSTGLYVLNSLLSRFFFTVFSDYLKLIEPFYEDLFTFKHFSPFLSANFDSPEASFLTPCIHYSLTPLAARLFGAEAVENLTQNVINTQIPIPALFEAIPSAMGLAKRQSSSFALKYAKTGGEKTLRLKITQLANPEEWKIIEISSAQTLEQLHYLICDEFFLEPSAKYSFNTEKNVNVFTMYTSAAFEAKHKKTHLTALRDMPLEQSSVFYYCLERTLTPLSAQSAKQKNSGDVKNIIYEAEVIKINAPTGIESYPRIIRESRSCREFDIFK